MAITFPITGVTNTFSASRSPSFTLGTSPLENDIIVVFASSDTTAATTDVSGWVNVLGANTVRSDGAASLSALKVYHRVTNAEDTADTVTWTLTNLWNATETGQITVTVLRGVATSAELQGAASAASTSPSESPWVIAAVAPTADYVQITAGVAGDGTQTQTTPGTHTLQASGSSTQSNYLYSDNDLGMNGVGTGTTNVTPSGPDGYVSIVACFKPADDSRPARFTTTRLQAVNRAGSW